MRKLAAVVLILVLAAVGAYVLASRAAGPAIVIAKPGKFVGLSTPFEVVVGSPGVSPSLIHVFFEQNGVRTPLFVFDPRGPVPPRAPNEQVTDDGSGPIRWTRPFDKDGIPGVKSGPARIVVVASRAVLGGLRYAESSATRDVQVRLERPHISVVSTHHYVNLGGSEMVVYRISPADATSGVMVGDLEYPGYPAWGATVEGVTITDPSIRIAFFALRYDQDLQTSIKLFVRDDADTVEDSEFDHRVFPKPFKHSTIAIDDRFLDRVVPAILAGTSEVNPPGSTLDKFLAINGDLRKKNNEKIKSLAAQTSSQMLWRGVVFHSFTNTKVEAAFADFRTYTYQGREVDKQVHLGFDLASFAGTAIVAANRGKVIYAADLGIYGNCVIIDHGMGVQSLYAHLSSFAVQPGAMVEKDQLIGHSGMTGLAAGDHLHFTMLVNGQMVNPIEWWDPHWIEDRILRKLREHDLQHTGPK